MKIYLTALIKAKPGNESELKEYLLELSAASNREEACLQYELHFDEAQHQFIFHETWANQAGLDQHNQEPHIKKFVEKGGPLMDGPVIIYKTEKLT
ncbi:antibiotic biosynthesis monooxygenase [Mucilaginibacter pallidiroseus]|uniref:Antibiotic biosynthesis monooxygenase n=1 Tax=Mucilaginibacter pallidiroseus TaxID=2599295 RepID=A0A563UI78_9SPHI|nr:putative quinol monooxygenase [Mucilaginibacter pallidiroseus]TWR30958.1 antibiotic biosynthesis monooxygenase [Mucilaginibacter pallidiroseus]